MNFMLPSIPVIPKLVPMRLSTLLTVVLLTAGYTVGVQAQAPDQFIYDDYPTNSMQVTPVNGVFLDVYIELTNFINIPAVGQPDYLAAVDGNDPTILLGHGPAEIFGGQLVGFSFVNPAPSGTFFLIYYDSDAMVFHPVEDISGDPILIDWIDVIIEADGNPGMDGFIDGYGFDLSGNLASLGIIDNDNSSSVLNDVEVYLPVEFTYFQARANAEQQVLLEWATAGESGNERFEIERSTDGSRFQRLGVVSGAGDSNELISYHFLDEEPAAGVNYYRLKQVDYSGYYTYSGIVIVDMDGKTDLDIGVFPNPVSEGQLSLTIGDVWAGDRTLQVQLLDFQGRQLAQWKDLPVASQTLSLPDLASGYYNLVVTNSQQSKTTRISIH